MRQTVAWLSKAEGCFVTTPHPTCLSSGADGFSSDNMLESWEVRGHLCGALQWGNVRCVSQTAFSSWLAWKKIFISLESQSDVRDGMNIVIIHLFLQSDRLLLPPASTLQLLAGQIFVIYSVADIWVSSYSLIHNCCPGAPG